MAGIHNGSLTDICAPSNWQYLSDAEKAMCTRHGPYSPTSDYSFTQEAMAAARAADPMWGFTAGLVEAGLSTPEINVRSDLYEAQLRAADPLYSQKIKEAAVLSSYRQELEQEMGAATLNRLIYGGFSPLPPQAPPPPTDSSQFQQTTPVTPPPPTPSQIQPAPTPAAPTAELSELQAAAAALQAAATLMTRTPDTTPDPTIPLTPTTATPGPTPEPATYQSQDMMIKMVLVVLVVAVVGGLILMVKGK